MRYYLGPWVWLAGEEGGWSAPAGCVAVVDLRPLADQAQAGILGSKPYGFFAQPESESPLSSDYALLGAGDVRSMTSSTLMQDTWQSLLGYRPQGDKLVDLLADALTSGADPQGLDSAPPLMPTVGGDLEIHLARHSRVWNARFTWGGAFTNRIQARLHVDFRHAHQENPQHARKVLDYWRLKYRLKGNDWRQLVPPELGASHPGPLPHATTISDNFNRADADPLGSSSEGWSWTEVDGDFDIVSNAVRAPQTSAASALPSAARAESDLSGSDHYAQIDNTVLSATNSMTGAATRFSSSAKTLYGFWARDTTSTGHAIDKVVAGTRTNLWNDSIAEAAVFTVKGESNGSSQSLYIDGSLYNSVTDTSITSGTRTGFLAHSATTSKSTADNFTAADLAVGGQPTMRRWGGVPGMRQRPFAGRSW